jgi:hypothetical protein
MVSGKEVPPHNLNCVIAATPSDADDGVFYLYLLMKIGDEGERAKNQRHERH